MEKLEEYKLPPKIWLVGMIFGRLLVLSVHDNIFCDCCCICGTSKKLRISNLLNGTTQSCGCLTRENGKFLIKKAQLIKTKFKPREVSARRVYFRDRCYNDGDLSFDEFLQLSQNNCYYCESKPSNCYNVFKNDKRSSQFGIINGDFVYNGLDRIDSALLHLRSNIVVSCIICNTAKMTMKIDDFAFHINKIYDWRKVNFNGEFLNIKPFVFTSADEVKITNKIKVDKIYPGLILGLLTVEHLYRITNQNGNIFLCKCKCGTEKQISETELIKGRSTCGSKKCQTDRRLKYSGRIANARHVLFSSAKKINFNKFLEISETNCMYCNTPPSNIGAGANKNEVFMYSGLDRLDPNSGYTLNNIVPACWNCNRMKGTSSLKEFDDWINKIFNNFSIKYLKVKNEK